MEFILIVSIYSITLFLFFVNTFVKIKDKIVYFFIFLCFLFSGFRRDIFPDYLEYVKIYNDICDLTLWGAIFNHDIHGEIGFKVINYATCFAGSSVPMFLLMSMFSFLVYILICIQFGINPLIAWVIYYPYSFLLKDLAQIRNSVASLLVVYAFLNFNRIKSVITIFIASMFFQTYAVCAVPFLSKFFKNRVKIVLCSMAIVLFFAPSFSFDQLHMFGSLNNDYSRYEQTDYIAGSSDLQKIKSVVIFMVILLFSFKYYYTDFRVRTLIISYFGGVIYYSLLNSVPIISQRIGGYLTSVEPFLISLIYVHLMSRSNTKHAIFIKVLYFVFVMLLSVLYFYTNMTMREFLINLSI